MSLIHDALTKGKQKKKKETLPSSPSSHDALFKKMSMSLEKEQGVAVDKAHTAKHVPKKRRTVLYATFFVCMIIMAFGIGKLQSVNKGQGEDDFQKFTVVTLMRQYYGRFIVSHLSGKIEARYEKNKFVCSGIMYDSRTPVCIVNGVILAIGAQADGARVVAIYPNKVVLRYQGEKVVLGIRQQM